MDMREFRISDSVETRYEVYYFTSCEWWRRSFKMLSGTNLSYVCSKEAALEEAAKIKSMDGFQTKIVEVSITRKEII